MPSGKSQGATEAIGASFKDLNQDGEDVATTHPPGPPQKTTIRRPALKAPAALDAIDTGYLETLIGYNARRAALCVIAEFLPRMAVYGLRPVDFSVLSVIGHNPGVTSRQLCSTLDILPPNLVGLLKSLQQRTLIERHPHPHDRRAMGLHLSQAAKDMMKQAEHTASELELGLASRNGLTATERQTLIELLRKVYR